MREWNELPEEIREMIVQRSTENTRNALRACSIESKLLVESTRLKSLFYLGIYGTHRKWTIHTRSTEFQSSLQSFASFEELEQNLLKLLKTIHCIKRLYIFFENIHPPLKLKSEKTQSRILVESFEFAGTDELQQQSVLLQIEPVYLRKITLRSSEGSSRIFDSRQVICAEKLKVYGYSRIREDQLLKLNAYEVNFGCVPCSINEYIKKCTLEAGTRLPSFKFRVSSCSDLGLWNISTESSIRTVNLKIPNSKLKLKVIFEKVGEVTNRLDVRGGVVYQSESSVWGFWRCRHSFRTVEQLKITFEKEDSSWKIVVRRQFCCQNEYEFQEFGEFQRKIDEIMENLDLIKDFSIKLTGSTEAIRWRPKKNKLMVKKLSVEGDNNITSVSELLEQIGPKFLMDVTIDKNNDIVDNFFVFKTPQIQNASRVKVLNVFILDENLLEIDNICFSFAGIHITSCITDLIVRNPALYYEEAANLILTAAGINLFLKKCVRNAATRQVNFDLGNVSTLFHLDQTEVIKGLDIIERRPEFGHVTHYVINSDHSDYVLNVRLSYLGLVSGFVSHRGHFWPCNSF